MNLTKTLLLAAGAAAALTLAGCNKAANSTNGAASADTAGAADAVRAVETQWNADYKAKDQAKIEAHYTADGTLMAPGEPAATGTQAIHAALTQMLADPALSLRFDADSVGVASAGDMAYTRGHFTITQTDPQTKKPVTQTGYYVTVYKKQADGAWKAVEDIATPGAPAAAAASAKPG